MLKVYLLASGEIGVPVLAKLLEHHRAGELELAGIGTQPDRPAGRKRTLMPTPVGAFAQAEGWEVDKFVSLNDGTAEAKLKALDIDFLLVVSYGQLLKQPILELPRYGCVNVHASLLPRYRGASPIAAAIANQDKETGVCFMDMELGLDTGKVFYTCRMPLNGTEYADALELEMGRVAGEHTLKVLEAIAAGELPGTVQDSSLATMTTKIKKCDGQCHWHLPAAVIEARVRAYAPWPGVYFNLTGPDGEKKIQITKAAVVENPGAAPGVVLRADRKHWIIACGEGALELLELVPPGKKAMSGANFLNGCREDLTGRQL